MSARTRNVLYVVFIVVSLTIILGLSISYVAIARSFSAPAHHDQSMRSAPPPSRNPVALNREGDDGMMR